MTARRPEVSSQGFDTFLTVSGDLREFAKARFANHGHEPGAPPFWFKAWQAAIRTIVPLVGGSEATLFDAGRAVIEAEPDVIEAHFAQAEAERLERERAALARARRDQGSPPPTGQIGRPANATVGSPHTTRRSNKRTPMERWDLDEPA